MYFPHREDRVCFDHHVNSIHKPNEEKQSKLLSPHGLINYSDMQQYIGKG